MLRWQVLKLQDKILLQQNGNMFYNLCMDVMLLTVNPLYQCHMQVNWVLRWPLVWELFWPSVYDSPKTGRYNINFYFSIVILILYFFCLFQIYQIYIIIWLRLYVLSVQSLSPPKPAGLDPPPNFCRHTPNWLRNTDSQKKFEKKLHEKFLNFFSMKS
jgi:hypothetical protein